MHAVVGGSESSCVRPVRGMDYVVSEFADQLSTEGERL